MKWRWLVVLGLALLVGLGAAAWRRAQAAARVEAGARLYREGRSPVSGAPVKALVGADLEVDGATVTCVTCHLRSGAGSLEGRVVAPPIAGAVLFAPLATRYKGVVVTDAPPRRPAYTRASLADALRRGVDPTGRALNQAMPRYALSDDELDPLIDYLWALSSAPSPGVEAQRLHLATVITPDAPAEDREVMRFALEKFISFQNASTQPRTQGLDNRSARMSKNMLGSGQRSELAFQALELEVWQLEGPPETWRAQLETALARQPVVALVSGLSASPWAPIAAFADAHHLPTVLPITELPVIDAGADSYTLYFSQGAFLEGAALARSLTPGDEVVELVHADPLAEARARGFDEALARVGRSARRVALPTDVSRVGIGPTTTVVVWDAPGELGTLERLPPHRATFASAVALGPSRASLPETVRAQLRATWPARDTADEQAQVELVRPWLKDSGAGAIDSSSRAYAVAAAASTALQVFSTALMDVRGPSTADALLDALGLLRDQRVPHFDRLSFGAGQRFVSNGVWLVEIADDGALVKRSEWLTY